MASSDRPALHRSGWPVGVIGGILLVLLAFPPSRYTLVAQFQFALEERSLPFLHTLMARPDRREIARLDRVASEASDDYLIQVGRATVLATQGGLHQRQRTGNAKAGGDNTLYRLASVVERFPQAPGAYAHLSRYMMTDRIRLERNELPDQSVNRTAGSIYQNSRSHTHIQSPARADRPPLTPNRNPESTARPNPDDLRTMEWSLRAGERRDPDNAFWPAMLATTYFTAKRDLDGLDALHRASVKTQWDAYIYEEVLGEWRLYSAAYGDNGAIQKIGPLSLVSFPHLGEIRKMGQFVRYLADRAEREGRDDRAIELRRELMLLGIVMRSRAQWAYEALIGTYVCQIAGTDSQSKIAPGSTMSVALWQSQAPGYIALLKRNNRISDVVWTRREIDNCCQLRNRIDLARYDASYPGIPPGIPLTPLFGSWMACVCIIQEILTLVAVTGIIRVLEVLRRRSHSSQAMRRLRATAIVFLFTGWTASVFMADSGVPSTRYMLLFLLLSALNVILLADAINTARAAKRDLAARHGKDPHLASFVELNSINGSRNWSSHYTMLISALITCPALIGMWLLWPLLSTQHPVAAALTSLIDVSHSVSVGEVFQVSLFGTMVTLTALVSLSLLALTRKRLVLPEVCIGLTRLGAPIVVCLVFAYVIMLNRTILLDVNASRAISDAARNDLQWVLTHSEEPAQP